VGALRAVEAQCFVVGARGWRVCRRVRDCGSLAVIPGVDGVPAVEEEGGGCGEEDVSDKLLVRLSWN